MTSQASKFHFISAHGEKFAPVLEKNTLSIHAFALLGDKSALRKIVDAKPSLVEKKDFLGRTPLMCSVLYNHVDCASFLIKAGARVNNSDNCGQTALHLAVNKGFHKCVKLLLSSGALWYQKDYEGVTPLHFAAIHNLTKCLVHILKELRPGEVDAQDSSKKTALHWSSAYTNIDHIRLLLNQDANICIPDEDGKTPVHWAAMSNDTKAVHCVKVLLEKEPAATDWQDYEGRAALHLAVASGTIETIEYLTSKGNCDIDILDNMFCTPLHWAAKLGLPDKVGLLLDRGAAYKSADDNGATPLHYAAHHNEAATVKMFLSRSYITDVPDNDGRNALIWASARNSDDVIKVMAQYGGKLSNWDQNGIAALHAASIQGHTSTIELLLELGIPIDVPDVVGMTPLLRACEMGRAKATQVLINQGASLTASDQENKTCLHWAAESGHAYLCQMLLHYGCPVDSRDLFGMTPLHFASLSGYMNCVSVLLESKADPNVTDYEGKTPLHCAVISDHLGIVKLLCEYDALVNSMALQDDWLTPLDCSLIAEHPDISEYLESQGGLTSFEIETIAANRIQEWYRKHKGTLLKRLSKNSSNVTSLSRSMSSAGKSTTPFNKSSCTVCSKSSSSTSSALEINYGQKQRRVGLTSLAKCIHNCYNDEDPENANINSRLITPSRIPVAMWRVNKNYLRYRREREKEIAFQDLCKNCQRKKNNSSNPIFCIEDKAAVIVQKTRRRFSLKSKFYKIRRKVKAAFLIDDDRKAAEDYWDTQLAQFHSII